MPWSVRCTLGRSAADLLAAAGVAAMGSYDPLLTGAFNLYNVTLSALAVVGLIVAAALIVRAARRPTPVPGGFRRVAVTAGICLVGIGALTFLGLTFAEATGDIPAWGVFYVLPAAFLVGVAVLSMLRAAQAGQLLAMAAVVTFIAQIALGFIADQIDPQWGVDEIDKGAVAFACLFFCLPAGLSAGLLVFGGTPSAEEDLPAARPPRAA